MIPRHRYRAGLQPGLTITEKNQSGVVTFTTHESEFGSYAVMDDVVTPGFRRRMAKGELFFNPMSSLSGSRYTFGFGWGVQQNSVPANIWTLSGSPVWYITNLAGHYPVLTYQGMWLCPLTDLSRLLTEAATGMAAERGNVINSNNWETLAELHKTWAMVRHPVKTFLNFDKKFEGRVWKTPAQAWLAYRYGARPLVLSISEILEAMKRVASKGNRVTSRHRTQYTYYDTVKKTQLVGAFNIDVTTKRSHIITARAMSLDEFTPNKLEQFGLSGKQLLQLPWELIPGSFVVDWIANVGDYISSQLPVPHLRQLGSCQTLTSQIVWESTLANAFPISGYTLTAVPFGYIKSSILARSRGPLSTPALVIKSDFRSYDLVRKADALALAVQTIGSRVARMFS